MAKSSRHLPSLRSTRRKSPATGEPTSRRAGPPDVERLSDIDARCDGILRGPRPLEWLSAAQKDRCFYCGCETWLPLQRRQEAKFRARWDLPAERSLASQLAFDCRMASIEHLRRRAEAGGDSPSNLAMACAYCNSSRRNRTPEIHALVMCGLKRVGRHPCFPTDGTSRKT